MSLQQITMDIPAAPGNGTPLKVEGYGDKLVELVATTGDYDLEWSSDGSAWNVIAANLVASAIASTEDATNTIPRAAKFLRWVTNTGGDGAATMTGAYR